MMILGVGGGLAARYRPRLEAQVDRLSKISILSTTS